MKVCMKFKFNVKDTYRDRYGHRLVRRSLRPMRNDIIELKEIWNLKKEDPLAKKYYDGIEFWR
jgi:hypothetical protein